MSDDTDIADEVMHYVKLIEALLGLGLTLWMVWILIPAGIKIDLRGVVDAADAVPAK